MPRERKVLLRGRRFRLPEGGGGRERVLLQDGVPPPKVGLGVRVSKIGKILPYVSNPSHLPARRVRAFERKGLVELGKCFKIRPTA